MHRHLARQVDSHIHSRDHSIVNTGNGHLGRIGKSLLNDPNPKSNPKHAANCEAAELLMRAPADYFARVKECAKKSLECTPVPAPVPAPAAVVKMEDVKEGAK